MQLSTLNQYIPLTGAKEGHRYSIMITGALSAVTLEFQHEVDGAWFTDPTFGTPAQAAIVFKEVPCVVPRMRLKNGAGAQEGTPWVATWVKQTSDTF